jgi:HlyD family secretion protein
VIVGAVVKSGKESVTEVKTAEAKTMEYEDKVLATGKAEVLNSAELAALMSSKLKLNVQEGDRVAKGQVLGELDVSEQQQQLKAAQDALKAAEANLSNAKKAKQEAAAAVAAAEKNAAEAAAQLESTTAALQQGKASQEELTAAQQNSAQTQQALAAANAQAETLKMQDPAALQLQVDQAKAQVDAARAAVEKGKLTSPIDGVVLQVAAKSGSYVQPGVPLITVGSPDDLQVVANLSEQDINGIEAGQEAEVRWAGAPQQVVKGEVSGIAPVVSTPEMGQTETFIKVYITLEKGEVSLKPGATADVVIYRIKPRRSLLVANEALVNESEQKYIFIIDKGAAKKCAVETGENNELYTEIKQGIKSGSKVILDPSKLKDGQKVRGTGGGAK